MSTIITGANAETIPWSIGKWKGKEIAVTHQDSECPIEGHDLEVMHHYDDKGRHYCPTGFLICSLCGGIADEPTPYECTKGPQD